MNITLDQLEQGKACFPGLDWWRDKFGPANVEYQTALNGLSDINRVDWARWLLNRFGSDHSVTMTLRQFDVNLIAAGSIDLRGHGFIDIQGSILAGGNIVADNALHARENIVSGANIVVAGQLLALMNITAIGDIAAIALKAGGSIRSGGTISAGAIRAGGEVRAHEAIACPDVHATTILAYATGMRPPGNARGQRR